MEHLFNFINAMKDYLQKRFKVKAKTEFVMHRKAEERADVRNWKKIFFFTC